ncbi:alpha/beta hydrolase [Salinimicrobium marinum]|uniref:Alpha/beta hydrolase n=1 Tax=Salinimicrobium marinum TaxID=680283 RepID=A0A918VYW8_9FLAO|nr:alpha/beta hydrolase [Salinimicrobium marinum]GHA35912.1 alpha/beta hydrolase [Salinimicrobium marinum]
MKYKNTNIFYTSRRTGNPVVLLHGFLESGNIWEDLLNDYSGNRQMITIDLPGHGKSGVIGKNHTMEEMEEAVHHVLQELKLEKVDFIGHSMGGYVSLAFLEKYPEMVGKIVLLNSTPAADSEERKENRERAIDLVQRNKEGFVNMAISNLLTPESHQMFQSELKAIKTEALQFPTEGITAALEGMKIRKDRISVLARFKGEKFILAGEQDPILNHNDIKTLAEKTGCKFYSFPGGHLTSMENKEEFLRIMYFIE